MDTKASASARDRIGGDRGRLRPRGSSQSGLRQYNERVVLQAIRLHGPLPGAEIARLTHLTAQTVSLITKRLLDEGLLAKDRPVRGKVGQPSVPLSLNPEGAYAIGIKVGRRSLDMLLVDFTGTVRERWSLGYAHADPDLLLPEIALRLKDIRRILGPARRSRLQGVGIAAPLSMGGWQQLLDFPQSIGEKWQRIDLAGEVRRLTRLPVELVKDTAAACMAELVAGRGRNIASFLYIFVDTFIGGGLVLDNLPRFGDTGNAGAVGSMPIPTRSPPGGAALPPQLLSVASLLALERAFVAARLDPTAITDARALQPPWERVTTSWLRDSAAGIAQAVNAAACVLDIEGVILDGSFCPELRATLVREATAAMEHCNWEGVARPQLLPGTIGADARALGGALLPLHANFAPDRDLFLKVPG